MPPLPTSIVVGETSSPSWWNAARNMFKKKPKQPLQLTNGTEQTEEQKKRAADEAMLDLGHNTGGKKRSVKKHKKRRKHTKKLNKKNRSKKNRRKKHKTVKRRNKKTARRRR